MKVQLLTIIVLFTIISCKTSSQEFESKSDPLIGTWKIEKQVVNFSNGTSRESKINDCTKKIRHSYYSDGTLKFKMVKENRKTGNCIEDSFLWTGNWSKLKRGKYETKHIHTYPKGQISGYSDSTDVFTFINDNKTLQVLTDFKKAGIILEPNSTVVSEVTTYTRVE